MLQKEHFLCAGKRKGCTFRADSEVVCWLEACANAESDTSGCTNSSELCLGRLILCLPLALHRRRRHCVGHSPPARGGRVEEFPGVGTFSQGYLGTLFLIQESFWVRRAQVIPCAAWHFEVCSLVGVIS